MKGLTEGDAQKIQNVRRAFETAWLENDSIKIFETLAQDAILIPHHGDQPVVGITMDATIKSDNSCFEW